MGMRYRHAIRSAIRKSSPQASQASPKSHRTDSRLDIHFDVDGLLGRDREFLRRAAQTNAATAFQFENVVARRQTNAKMTFFIRGHLGNFASVSLTQDD